MVETKKEVKPEIKSEVKLETKSVEQVDVHKQNLKNLGDGKDEYNVRIIRDYYGAVDIFYLENKDPNYAYRFIRDNAKNISEKTTNLLHMKGGWQLVPREHLVNVLKLDPTRDVSPDGLCRRGDQILARMPKELFDEKEEIKRKRAQDPVDAVERKMKKGDPNVGGSEIHESMKGIQTQEDLDM